MAQNASLNNLSLLLVAERDDVQGGMFREYFHNFPNVTVTKNPFEDLEVVDCLVIPTASSYCEKGNEITDYYMRCVRTRCNMVKGEKNVIFGANVWVQVLTVLPEDLLARFFAISTPSLWRHYTI